LHKNLLDVEYSAEEATLTGQCLHDTHPHLAAGFVNGPLTGVPLEGIKVQGAIHGAKNATFHFFLK